MSSPTTARRRAVPLTFAVLLAVLAGLVTLTAQRGAAHASDATGHDHANPTGLPKASQVAFHDQMRTLWEDHVTWTRLAIVTFADGSAGFGATATRLLQNQTAIGDAFQPFYGTANGNQLSALLHDHITIAVEILRAAKAGDTAAFNDASTRWYA